MNPEQEFWARVLELAHSQLKKTTFDFFVAEAKLIKIENKKATIHLDSPVKKLFWEQNLADIILTAGFEIYNDQISVLYVFETEDKVKAENRPVTLHQPEMIEVKKTPPVATGLKSKYTFENFVQGDGNQWAKAAALAVSDNLGGIYNPLFIYGGPGLGKTHLLNAIGNEVLEHTPDARIKYVPAETFINDFLEHLRLGEMDSFKKIYRSLDLLLIDDIQALSKKVSTQEEFFNTFNALHGENKQIVLTSDRSPDYLENLEERLVTRFKWGLTSDITPPNFETRIAILRNKIEEFDLIFPNETIEYLAGQFDSNVRDLEGALKDINLLASMKHIKEITIAAAHLAATPVSRRRGLAGGIYISTSVDACAITLKF